MPLEPRHIIDFLGDATNDKFNSELLDLLIKKVNKLCFEYAILAIFYLSRGNVGHAILILTDILEKYDTLKPEKITASFVFEFVYPKVL